MARHEDSPGLFGYGLGQSTAGTIRCDICGKVYNEGADDNEDYRDENVIRVAGFSGINVVECCFERLERAVYEHIDRIIPWHTRILEKKKKSLEKEIDLLNRFTKAQSL